MPSLLTHETVKVEFHDYFVDDLIKCTRRMFAPFTSTIWKLMQYAGRAVTTVLRWTKILSTTYSLDCTCSKKYDLSWVAVIGAKNHKRQRRERQSVTAKREKSQTPQVLTAILTLLNLT